MSVQVPLGAVARARSFEPEPRPARAAAIGRRGFVALLGLVLGTLILTLSAGATDSLLPQSTRPLPRWLAGPLGSAGPGLGASSLLLVLGLMLIAYLTAVSRAQRLPAGAVLASIAAMHAVVLLGPPLLSTDVFSYQAYARMWAQYGIDPYLHGPHTIALDPVYPFVGARWVATPSTYGPLFTLLSAPLAAVSIGAAVFAFKASAALASLGTVTLVWHAARRRGVDPVRAAALVGLNPLVVLYGVGGAHNDLLTVLALSAALYAVSSERQATAGALLALAAGVKLTAGLAAPFMLAGAHAAGPRERARRLALGAAPAAAAVAIAGALAFGFGPLQLPAIVGGVQSRGDWHSLSGLISTKLGMSAAGHAVALALAAAFTAVCSVLLWRVWRGALDWLDAAAWATLAVLGCAGSLLPWYVAWALPLVALSADRRLWRAALASTALVQLLQLPDYIPHGAPLVHL